MQVTTSLGSFEFTHDPAVTQANGRPVARKTTLLGPPDQRSHPCPRPARHPARGAARATGAPARVP